MSVGEDKWRRPVLAHAEETVSFYAGEPQRAIKWHVHGPDQEDDAERMRMGLVCTECLSTFPAKPDMKNLGVWRNYAKEWAHIRPEQEVLSLVSRNLCPTCSTEVSPELFALSYGGMDKFAPQPLEDIIGLA